MRRAFSTLFVSALTLAFAGTTSAEPLPGGTLDPAQIEKYARPLTVPEAMPETPQQNASLDYYEIAVRQFQQEVVPGLMTTVWGYGSVTDPASFSYPARTIEASYSKPVRVKWINDLKNANGEYLPHLLPIDQTLHWANPPMGGDTMGMDAAPYTGPVPMVPHLHGAHVTQESDGYPEAWFLPAAVNMPDGYARVGSKYNQFKGEAEAANGQVWEPGTAVYQYPNDQRAATLWFHDHSMGMTRANVYAGPAGFYLLRGGPDDLTNLPSGAYEIPLVVQDRSFNADGSLFYPGDRAFFEGLAPAQLQIPLVPDSFAGEASDIAPIWNPEFFGNTMVVNGKTWPYLNVEQRRYRFRILNASDSRFFMLKLSNGQSFWQIGNDGGFLSAPVELGRLLIAPAERADVVIDFTGLPEGTQLVLQNVGPDEPFGGGEPEVDFAPADADTTGQVMQFRVVPATGTDDSTPPTALMLPIITPIEGMPMIRQLSLNELMSGTVHIPVDETGDPVLDEQGNLVAVPAGMPGSDMFGPAKAELGILENGAPVPYPWMQAVTENPMVGQTEIWELYNYTADAHPIHLHQVQFEVINREFMGEVTNPEPWETGFKDTVIAYPGDEGENPGITRIKVKFDLPGLYVWHCHILSHEDNEMMRPLCVGEGCGGMGGGTAPVITTTPVLTATQGLSYAYRVAASDPDGGPLTFTLDSAPAGMKFNPVFDTAARIVWKPTKAQVGMQHVTVRVTDPDGLFTTQTFSIEVAGVNSAPVAKNDAYIMIKGGTLNVAAPGLLGNDRDLDAGDTLTAANFSTPPVGTLAGNANGSFSFTPPADFTGQTTFTYRAQDSLGLLSPAATVTVTVRGNKPPLALADTVSTAANTPLLINVLANDSDPDTARDPYNRIDPASVFIPKANRPNNGGKAVVNADGTISYTPKQGFTGIEEFMYRVRDTYSTPATSKAVLVSVTVQ